MKKNKDTEENSEFCMHIEEIAEQVRHWPKWAGGKGLKPLRCPTCDQELLKSKWQSGCGGSL